MADVLLTHSNHVYSDPKQTAKMQPYPPLQTILAAAVLENAGFSVALYDPTLDFSQKSFQAALERHQPVRLIVCEDDFNFLSKMCLVKNRELAFWMAQTAREAGVVAVVHGSDASDHIDDFLRAGFSAVIVGEVENTLRELVQGQPMEEIRGLAHKSAARMHIQRNPPRALQTDLDQLPAPAWHLVDMERYRAAWTETHGLFSLNMASSRGCPYRCNWCAKPIYGNAYHARSATAVAEEMSFLKRTYRPDHIWFADDIFALSPRWTREFASEVERLDALLPFKMQSRCDLMTRNTVGDLRRAGCHEVWMGAESGSQKILSGMDKDIRVADIYAAVENLRRHEIRVGLFVQFGYPGEEWSDILATIQMLRDLQPDDVGISVSYPLPGTKFHQIVAAEMGSKANWRDSSDLTMMFRGQFPTEFYRALANALHQEIRGGRDCHEAWQEVHKLRDADLVTN